MKNRYKLYRRPNGIFYREEITSRKRSSLATRDTSEAMEMVAAANQAASAAELNHRLGLAYLDHADEDYTKRTWLDVLDEYLRGGAKPKTKERMKRSFRHRALSRILSKTLCDTRSADFTSLFAQVGPSHILQLKVLHNLAVGMDWLPRRVLAPKLWPRYTPKMRTGTTLKQHLRIVGLESDPEKRAYYWICWYLGGSQTDMANLRRADFSQNENGDTVVSYYRTKTGEGCSLVVCEGMLELLRSLPEHGSLFPKISKLDWNARAKEFRRRCKLAGVEGVTLHCYRYAWAERAFEAGIPERYAMAALGHSSKIVHRVYAKGAKPVCPAFS